MGAHLHRTLKFLPSATCRRDRLLPMASTRVTMSEPKPGGWLGSHTRRGCGGWEFGGWWEDGFLDGLTIICQIQGAHCASITHQVLYHLSTRRAQLKVGRGACSGQQATGGEDHEPNGPALPPRSPSPKGQVPWLRAGCSPHTR